MVNFTLDTKGWKRPRPTLEMTIKIQQLKKNDTLEVIADCPSFEGDVKNWCQRMKKKLLWLKNQNNEIVRCQIKV